MYGRLESNAVDGWIEVEIARPRGVGISVDALLVATDVEVWSLDGKELWWMWIWMWI